jgi:hypothetical protein
MLNLSKSFREKNLGPRSIWDTLYDMYCYYEEGGEYNGEFSFDCESDPIKLQRIKEFLGSKCEDYFRFINFYNGITFGQWYLMDDKFIDEVIADHRKVSGNKGNKLPIALHYPEGFREHIPGDGRANIIECYLTTGEFVVTYLNEVPYVISQSFEEFMHECVLGPRYLEFGEEDASYHFLQKLIKKKDEEQADFFRKFGKRSDEDENPTRDPRVMTGYRKYRIDVASQIYEQTKNWPDGIPYRLELDKDDPEQVRCIPIHDKDHQS